jgi:hypothetical protein
MTKGKTKKFSIIFKIGLLTVCLVPVFIIAIHINKNQYVTEIEPRSTLSLQEAQKNDSFGLLFPKELLEGYTLEDNAAVYNKIVLQAKFYNNNFNDELTIMIAKKEHFGDVQINSVLYRETLEQRGSYIYIEAGDYIIYYSFNNRNINEINEFWDMVHSANYFSLKK